MERHSKIKRDLLDLEKAYDKVLRKVMWWAIKKVQIPCKCSEELKMSRRQCL